MATKPNGSNAQALRIKKRTAFNEESFSAEFDLIREAITGIPASDLQRMEDTRNGIYKNGRKKIVRRKPGTKPSTNYFTETTDAAIVAYQEEADVERKKKMFTTTILPAFESLAENLINVYGFTVMHESKQDLKNECIEFLYGSVMKYDQEKGYKAFSYFNVVAKNWLTIKSKQNSKRTQNYISIDNRDEISIEDLERIENYQVLPSHDEVISPIEVHLQLIKLVDAIEGRVKTENEVACVKAIKTLVDNIENVDLLSKRAVLLYIREMTNLSSKQLSIVLSSLKKHYKELKKQEEYQI